MRRGCEGRYRASCEESQVGVANDQVHDQHHRKWRKFIALAKDNGILQNTANNMRSHFRLPDRGK
jgi:hypothetical protein